MRILYVDFPSYERTYLIGVYKKTVKLDLTQSETEEVRKLIIELRNELKKKHKSNGGLLTMARTDERSIYKSIISGLDEAIKYEKEGTLKGARTRRVTIAPVPHYGAKKVKSIRNELGLSQIAFAKAFGVSKKTVEAWEAGRNEPQGPAQRILELLQKEANLLEKYEIVQT